MTVRVYRSTDSSAPVLSGSAGALIGVLDACLVNGYGAATAAGWAIAFTGTNLRAYRAASGNRFYMRVDDTGTVNGRTLGYESMSDVNTGTAGFPTNAQISGGLYILKSSAADANARAWIVIATETMFYMFINSANAGAGAAWATNAYQFGDFTSFKSGDIYGTRICANINTTNSTTNNQGWKSWGQVGGGAMNGMYVTRAQSGAGGSINVGQCVSSMVTGTTTVGNGMTIGANVDPGGTTATQAAATYPNGADGGLYTGRLYVNDSATVLRGYVPGLWAPMIGAGTAPALGDTWSGNGDLSGKTFELMLGTNGTTSFRLAMETSNTW